MPRLHINGYADARRCRTLFGDIDLHLVHSGYFVPGSRAIVARGNIVEREAAVFGRLTVPGTGSHHDRRVHVAVNVAVHLDDAAALELYCPALRLRIVAQIERLRSGKRKHVMKDRIPIGELHRRTGGNYQQVGLEPAVALLDLESLRSRWGRRSTFQPYHRAVQFRFDFDARRGRGGSSQIVNRGSDVLACEALGNDHLPRNVACDRRRQYRYQSDDRAHTTHAGLPASKEARKTVAFGGITPQYCPKLAGNG